MKKPELITKEELPKLFLGGVSVFTISWFIFYLSSVLLSNVIFKVFGNYQDYAEALSGGLADAGLIYQQGLLSGVIIAVSLVLLVILVAYDEFYFSRQLQGFKKRLFWGSSWGLIFVVLDLIIGSICFNRVGFEGGTTCSTFSIAGSLGIFYWLFILLIVVLPFASEHYGRAKASYKKG